MRRYSDVSCSQVCRKSAAGRELSHGLIHVASEFRLGGGTLFAGVRRYSSLHCASARRARCGGIVLNHKDTKDTKKDFCLYRFCRASCSLCLGVYLNRTCLCLSWRFSRGLPKVLKTPPQGFERLRKLSGGSRGRSGTGRRPIGRRWLGWIELRKSGDGRGSRVGSTSSPQASSSRCARLAQRGDDFSNDFWPGAILLGCARVAKKCLTR